MICATQKRKGAASPCPSSSFLSIQISAAFVLHPSRSDISINRTFSALLAELILISFLPAPLYLLKNMIEVFSGALLCSLSWSSIVFFQYFLSFTQYLHFLHRIWTPSAQLHQTFQLRVPSGQTGNTYLFFSMQFSLIVCWATCLMKIDTSSDISSCSCNSVTPTATSSVPSRCFGRLLESETPPSPVFHRNPLAFFLPG